MRLIGLALLSAGCQVVFPLDDPGTCGSPIGHDEDGDKIDDACDRCPGIADASDRDTDGDGVGDACDPRITEACELRVRFDGFATAPADAVLTDDWKHDDDDLLQDDTSATTALVHFPSTPFDDVVVRASITILRADLDDPEGALFELGSGGSAIGDEPSVGYACQLHTEPAQAGFDVRLIDEIGEDLITFTNFSGDPFDNTFTFETVNTPEGALGCSVSGPQGVGAVTSSGATRHSNGEIFVFANNVAGRVHWIDVIQNVCPR